jgi:3-methylfumaryl-CoA hydratase
MASVADLEGWLTGWDPPAVTVEDTVDERRAAGLAALLDRPPLRSSSLPALWHWLYFLDWVPTEALGPDGHPLEGDFLPPLPQRTRMFVGGRLQVGTGLRTGGRATRRSAAVAWTVKDGRSGAMLFVTVRHEVRQGGRLALVDEQDLMYRSGPANPSPTGPARPDPVVSEAPWQEAFVGHPVTLFRFSALTANSHRIHYDRPYATAVEGYPGLVVHGPLLALLMAGLAARHRPDRPVASMQYRFARPVFAGDPVVVTGRPDGVGATLAVLAADGATAARADMTFA